MLIALAALVGLLAVSAWLAHVKDNPLGDVKSGLLYSFTRFYLKRFQRLRVEGLEHVPTERWAGPMIVVAIHTAGIDPLIVQSNCRFWIRWMMAEDMRIGVLEWLWRWAQIITVDRTGERRDMAPILEALRYAKRGGVVGIFPEGVIERPARQLKPFEPGVGMLIARTKARVLPAIITGTPEVSPAWASIWNRGHAVVTFHPIIEYADSGLDAAGITADLQQRFLDITGWSLGERAEPQVSMTGEPVPQASSNDPKPEASRSISAPEAG